MSESPHVRTQSEVAQLTAAATAGSTRGWVPGHDADPAAIRQVKKDFDGSLIPPSAELIEVEQHIAAVLNISPGLRAVWFITKPTTQRVFVDDSTGLFGVAWGPDATTGNYVDLGIRTDDPIDAFLA